MSHLPGVLGFDRIAMRSEDVTDATLLGICASMKPAPGRTERSAVRGLLCHALATVGTVYKDVWLLDLRNHPLPLFDGRLPDDVEEPALGIVLSCVRRAGGLLLAVPAYWSGVSGVFKNFVDVLCGPAYDLEEPGRTVFTDKPVGLLVVGADDGSALRGAQNAEEIMLSTGAKIVGRPVVLGSPRSVSHDIDPARLSADLIALTAELARESLIARAVAPVAQ